MKSLDRPLSWRERWRMRAHLAICDACTSFSAQMRTLREAMHRLGRDP
jgi:hypothetical protein